MVIDRPPQVVFLDVDGTIADFPIDWSAVRASIKKILRRHRIPATGGVTNMLRRTLRISPQLVPQILRRITIQEQRNLQRTRLRPGTAGLLRFFQKHKLPVFALSNNHSTIIDSLLSRYRIRRYFTGIIGRHDTVAGARLMKPNPQPALQTLQRLNVPKTRALVIGNDMVDLRLANRGGLDYVIVSDSFTHEPEAVRVKSLAVLRRELERQITRKR